MAEEMDTERRVELLLASRGGEAVLADRAIFARTDPADWHPYQLKRGVRKGTVVWKHETTGSTRDTPPAGISEPKHPSGDTESHARERDKVRSMGDKELIGYHDTRRSAAGIAENDGQKSSRLWQAGMARHELAQRAAKSGGPAQPAQSGQASAEVEKAHSQYEAIESGLANITLDEARARFAPIAASSKAVVAGVLSKLGYPPGGTKDEMVGKLMGNLLTLKSSHEAARSIQGSAGGPTQQQAQSGQAPGVTDPATGVTSTPLTGDHFKAPRPNQVSEADDARLKQRLQSSPDGALHTIIDQMKAAATIAENSGEHNPAAVYRHRATRAREQLEHNQAQDRAHAAAQASPPAAPAAPSAAGQVPNFIITPGPKPLYPGAQTPYHFVSQDNRWHAREGNFGTMILTDRHTGEVHVVKGKMPEVKAEVARLMASAPPTAPASPPATVAPAAPAESAHVMSIADRRENLLSLRRAAPHHEILPADIEAVVKHQMHGLSAGDKASLAGWLGVRNVRSGKGAEQKIIEDIHAQRDEYQRRGLRRVDSQTRQPVYGDSMAKHLPRVREAIAAARAAIAASTAPPADAQSFTDAAGQWREAKTEDERARVRARLIGLGASAISRPGEVTEFDKEKHLGTKPVLPGSRVEVVTEGWLHKGKVIAKAVVRPISN